MNQSVKSLFGGGAKSFSGVDDCVCWTYTQHAFYILAGVSESPVEYNEEDIRTTRKLYISILAADLP